MRGHLVPTHHRNVTDDMSNEPNMSDGVTFIKCSMELLKMEESDDFKIAAVRIQNHGHSETPHTHLQVAFSNGTTLIVSEWQVVKWVDSVTEFMLSLERMNGEDGSDIVLLHPCDEKACHPTFVQALDDRAGRWDTVTMGCRSCCVCMEEFEKDDTVVGMPCDRRHAGHLTCMKEWLSTQSTCPICRFDMPHEYEDCSSSDFETLIERAGVPTLGYEPRKHLKSVSE